MILDNVAFHKSRKADSLIKPRGAGLRFLPPYFPNLNPIEMAYSKLNALLKNMPRETSKPSAMPLAKYAVCSHNPNAGTTSRPKERI
ncbi:MAG: hypothetical protein GY947_05355 [Rhodobacteraceae bacterium]|nr:hypothetical protein [Paracoccaceae bacterium]